MVSILISVDSCSHAHICAHTTPHTRSSNVNNIIITYSGNSISIFQMNENTSAPTSLIINPKVMIFFFYNSLKPSRNSILSF